MRRGYQATGAVDTTRPIPNGLVRAAYRQQVEWQMKQYDRSQEEIDLNKDCMCENNDPECVECWWTPGGVKIAPDSLTFLMPPPPVYAQDDKASTFKFDVTTRFQEAEELLLRKHKDYSAKNIAQSPGGPLNGLRVRMHDKMARINNLLDKGTSPEYEPLRDSFLDLCNYSLIAMMVLDDVWPKE